MGLLSFPVLYTYGNLAVIDAYFFGASASTESGLNTYGFLVGEMGRHENESVNKKLT